ncbi:MAG: hypothetical protein GY856_23205 [bacterium]|nr:hypothetical protein [bacterium]
MDRKTHYSIPLLAGMALCLLSALPVAASDVMTLAPEAASQRLVLSVNGPGELIYEKVFEAGSKPVFELFDKAGKPHPDGSYKWELRSAPLASTRVRGAEQPAIEQKRVATPAASGSFAIIDGGFAAPDLNEELPTKDILHYDDVIITGSLCIGFDCANGESFGYDTLKLKENNLRMYFEDTSAGSFPSGDWRLRINDTTSGGASYFAVEDGTNGRTPFRIETGAPTHSLYVEDYGRVGLGTSIPYVELHMVDGDSPTIRLDQDGSSGWTAQRWDMCGNETNFFIRDVTNGSKLSFRIQPNTPSNTLTLKSTGYVGIGTWSPLDQLHIEDGGSVLPGIRIVNTDVDSEGWAFRVVDADEFRISKQSISGSEFILQADGDLIITGSLTADGDTFPDYVFESDYSLMPLAELDAYIQEHKHLPNVPTAEDVDGGKRINMTELQVRLLEKVEELTLYTLTQEKTIAELEARLAAVEQADQ